MHEHGTQNYPSIFTCWWRSLLFATSLFGLITIRWHSTTRKHLFLHPQGDRSGHALPYVNMALKLPRYFYLLMEKLLLKKSLRCHVPLHETLVSTKVAGLCVFDVWLCNSMTASLIVSSAPLLVNGAILLANVL